jgi:hypothetical protein
VPESVEVVIHVDTSVDVPLGQPGTPGAPGGTGAQGPAGTITVGTVTTGEPGTDVEVENVGTASAAVLNFTIPEGQPGEDGVGGGGAWGSITGTLADQTDLATALDGKSDDGHTHAQGDVTGLTAALADKADAADVTTALAGKSDVGHTHAQSDVTGLTAALAGKSDTGHTHTASNVTDFNTAADARVAAGIIVAGTANNPHTTQGATRNSALPKNFWQYTGTEGVDDPTNAVDGDEWISA